MSASHSSLGKSAADPKLVKILLVGSTGTGKSALLKRLVGEEFTEDYIPTQDIDAKAKIYSKEQVQEAVGVGVAEEDLRFKIWDTTASAPFQSMVKDHYRDCALVVFTLDASRELSDQESYLMEQNNEVPEGAKRLVVVTKSDKEPRIIEDWQIASLVGSLGIATGRTGVEGHDYIYFSAKKDDILPLERLLFKTVGQHLGQCIKEERLTQEQQRHAIRLSAEELTEMSSVREKFTAAIKHLHSESEVLKNPKTRAAGQRFRANLVALQDQTLKELANKKRPLKDALQLAESANTFAAQVAHCATLEPQHIDKFHEATDHLKTTSLLGKIIGALIGAAIGVFIGVMAGAGLGPGAALTALYAGAKGAMAGAIIGGAVFSAVGTWCSLWAMKQPHPATRLEKEAEEIYSLQK